MAAGDSLVAAGLDGRLVTGAARIAGMAPAYSKEDPSSHGQFDLKPTNIQKLMVPHALAGQHCVGLAATGSGKTLSYVLPVLQYLVHCSHKQRIKREQGTYAVMLTPTRELAEQVAEVLNRFQSSYSWLTASALIGGASRKSDKSRLRKGVTILVATPGRLLDHLQNTHTFSLKRLAWLVLDEFDRLLDMGFAEAISGIVGHLKRRSGDAQLQVLATSATLTPEAAQQLDSITKTANEEAAVALVDTVHSPEGHAQIVTSVQEASRHLTQSGSAAGEAAPSERGELELAGKSVGTCDHHWCSVNIKWRFPTVVGMAAHYVGLHSRKMLLFLSTRQEVEHFTEALTALWGALPGTGGPHFIGGLHGGMAAGDRQSKWKAFSRAASGLLLATDVAARGLDAPAVHVIVQCALPSDPADYVHRAGRTARMGRRGSSFLMLQPHEQQYVNVLAGIGVQVTEASTTPWLSSLVGRIPPVEALPPPPAVGDDSTVEAAGGAAGGETQTPAMRALAIMRSTRDESAAGKQTVAAASAAKRWQVWYESLVEWDSARAAKAAATFSAYTRAYSTHTKQLKAFLHVKALHLGHVAKCFGLRSQPSDAGAGTAKAGREAAVPAHLSGKRSAAVPSYRKKTHNSMSEFAS